MAGIHLQSCLARHYSAFKAIFLFFAELLNGAIESTFLLGGGFALALVESTASASQKAVWAKSGYPLLFCQAV